MEDDAILNVLMRRAARFETVLISDAALSDNGPDRAVPRNS